MQRFISNFLFYPMLNLIILTWAFSQEYTRVHLSTQTGVEIGGVDEAQASHHFASRPFFTFRMNDTLISSRQFSNIVVNDSVTAQLEGRLKIEIIIPEQDEDYWKAEIRLKNISSQKITIENVVPLGENPDHVYITAAGPPSLARSMIFRPGCGPVGIILPDNAWEMGFMI